MTNEGRDSCVTLISRHRHSERKKFFSASFTFCNNNNNNNNKMGNVRDKNILLKVTWLNITNREPRLKWSVSVMPNRIKRRKVHLNWKLSVSKSNVHKLCCTHCYLLECCCQKHHLQDLFPNFSLHISWKGVSLIPMCQSLVFTFFLCSLTEHAQNKHNKTMKECFPGKFTVCCSVIVL